MRKLIILLCLAAALISCSPTSPPPDVIANGVLPTATLDHSQSLASTPADTPAPTTPPASGMPEYTMQLVIADKLTSLNGQMQVAYTNQENLPLEEIYLWLYPNLLGGALKVENVTAAGSPLTVELLLGGGLMRLPLAVPLAPGETIELALDFETRVPTNPDSNYGILSLMGGVLALAHFYPILAVYDENGWNINEPSRYGDIVYADAAEFTVSIDAPADLVLVASGEETPGIETSSGRRTTSVYAGPVRDFYLAGSRDYQVVSTQSGDVQVNLYLTATQMDRSQLTLDSAVRALQSFEQRYSPYPYTELDFVVTPNFALGIEYPGVIAMTSRLYDSPPPSERGLPEVYLESTVAHEVAHQWFYNMIGNDQVGEPWLDESLSQFATWQYYVDQGVGEENGFKDSMDGRWAGADYEAIAIGQPVRVFDGTTYSAIIYGRGPLFLIALREEMGTDAFDDFMRDYSETYTWGVATTAGFRALAEKHCNCDLTPLFEKWIYP